MRYCAGMQVETIEGERVGPRRRGVVALGALAVGIVVARCWPGLGAEMAFAAGCGACAMGLLTRGWACRVALMMAVAALGAGVLVLRVETVAVDGLARLTVGMAAGERVPIEVEGVIAEVPRVDAGRADPLGFGVGRAASTRFGMEIERVIGEDGERRASGRVTVWLGAIAADLAAGERVRVRGYFVAVAGPMNPGERDARLWAAQDGLAGRVSVEARGLISAARVPPTAVDRARSWMYGGLGWLRRGAASAFDAALGEEDEAGRGPTGRTLLGALLLGRQDAELGPLNDAFARLGLVHVLSISGFHLVVMAQVVLVLVRLTGDRGALEPVIAAVLVVMYLLIVPAEAPVVRSGLIVLGLLLAESLGRRYDRLNLLAWIACVLLLWRPMDAFEAGFQLSFGVTAALLWLGTRTQERMFPPRIRGLVGDGRSDDPGLRSWSALARGYVAGLVSSSVLAWAVATPIVLAHTGVLSPLAALTSVVMIPVFVVVLWLGFLVLLLGVVWPAAAGVLGPVLGSLGEMVRWVTIGLDEWPWMAVDLPAVSPLWAMAATGVVVWWFAGRGESVRRWWASAAVMAWLLLAMVAATAGWRGRTASMTALSVGSGRAVVIEEQGRAVMWGCGSRSAGAVRRVVPRAVRGLGLWRVRTVIVPSADAREWQGLAEAAAGLDVSDVLVTPGMLALAEERREHPLGRTIGALRERGVRVAVFGDGDQLALGEMTLTLRLTSDGTRAWGDLVGPGDTRVLLLGALKGEEAAGAVGARGPAWAVEWPEHGGTAAGGGGAAVVWTSGAARGEGAASAWPVERLVTGRDGAVRLEMSARRARRFRTEPGLFPGGGGVDQALEDGLAGFVGRLRQLLL